MLRISIRCCAATCSTELTTTPQTPDRHHGHQRHVRARLGAYIGYLGAFCLRYFALAGGMYALFYVALRHRSLAYRIQRTFPSRRWSPTRSAGSLLSAASTGLSTLLLYWLIRNGRSSVYTDAGLYGWPYLAFSLLLCVAGYDTWIYLAAPAAAHAVVVPPCAFGPHRVRNPTPFAAFSQHPIETLMGNVYFVLFVVLIAAASAGDCGVGRLHVHSLADRALGVRVLPARVHPPSALPVDQHVDAPQHASQPRRL
jgi:hypothetical protein